jgi:dihydropteroate synthase
MHVGPPRSLAGLPAPGRALVMGVVNVTPDSFSDGGRWFDTDRAVAHARRLVVEGADIVDVGGESTRPGAIRPSVQEELDRVMPVVERLVVDGTLVSVDTMRAEVAATAVDAGAVLVNDVSGGRADDRMFETVAARGASYVLMHWRAHSEEMQRHTEYGDVVADVRDEMWAQRELAVAAGIAPERIALDPGIGFSKTAEQNWDVLAATERYHELGHPLLIATSRKRFLGVLLADDRGELRPPLERDDGTTATTALAAAAGAWCIRAHAVRPTADAVRVATRWVQGALSAAGRSADPPVLGAPEVGR